MQAASRPRLQRPQQQHHHQQHLLVRPRRLPAAAAAANPDAAATSTADDGASSSSSPAKARWWEKNTEGWTTLETAADLARAAHEARLSGRRVLALDLYAPSCSVCKSSWPALSRLARDDALARDVLFAKASIEGDDIRRILKEHSITGIPWVLVMDVGENGPDAPPPPPSESTEAAGLFKSLAASFLKKQFVSSPSSSPQKGAGEAAVEASAPPSRVLDAAGAALVLGQGASFKKIAVLRSNLAAVPALVKRGGKVVVDPNGLVVVT